MAQNEKSDFLATDTNLIDRGLNYIAKRIQIKNHFVREIFAEVMGTAFLMIMGETGGAINTLSRGEKGDTITTNMAWGVGVFFAILMSGNVSGAIFNPAITITWGFMGKLPWKKVGPYCLAQTFGAFLGSAIVYCLYYDAINDFDGGVRQIVGINGTAGIFSTYPLDYVTFGTAILDQIVGTAFLVLAVLAASDPNNGLPAHLMPFAVAAYVMSNGYTFAYNAAGAINPARDLGPRIMTALAGYGAEVFTYRSPQGYVWCWIPIVGPILGGLVGAIIYQTFFGVHWPKKSPEVVSAPSNSPLIDMLSNNPSFANIYLSQQSMEFLDSIGKRDSVLPLVRNS